MYTCSLFKWFFTSVLLKWWKNHESPLHLISINGHFPVLNLNYRYWWWQASRRRSCWNSSSTSADRSSFVQRRCCRTGGAPSRDDGKRHYQSHDRLTGRDRPPSVQGIQPRPANGTCICTYHFSRFHRKFLFDYTKIDRRRNDEWNAISIRHLKGAAILKSIKNFSKGY